MRSVSTRGLPPLSEMATLRLLRERADNDGVYLNFIGAGTYEHHIPAVVSQLVARGDFCVNAAAQPSESVQGTLQLLYEFQQRMMSLLGLDAVGSGFADGASALADAVLMAMRHRPDARRVLVPRAVHPLWRNVLRTLTRHRRIEFVDVPYDAASSQTRLDDIDAVGCAALIIPQPNFFGVLEPVDEFTEWAHQRGLLVIAAVNPLAMALLKPPGEWGDTGADIAAGDLQSLGMALSEAAGFVACRAAFAPNLAGCVSATADATGKYCYRLLPNAYGDGVPPLAAAAYLAVMGAQGLAAAANASAANAAALEHALAGIRGVERIFSAPVFHEFVLGLSTPAAPVLHALKAQGILGGIPLQQHFPDLGHSLLVCATETKTAADIARYVDNMTRIIGRRFQPAPCSIKQTRNP